MSTTEQSATEQSASALSQPNVVDALNEAPPAGEEIHLPGPSIIPLAVAIGITLIVIGTTIDWLWSGLGLVIFVVAVGRWIMDVRRDIDSLPEEHHH
jgi:hypothetical protein